MPFILCPWQRMHSNRGTHCNSSEARRDHYNRVGLEQPQHGSIGWEHAFFCLLFFGIAVEPAVHGHRKVSALRRHEAKTLTEKYTLGLRYAWIRDANKKWHRLGLTIRNKKYKSAFKRVLFSVTQGNKEKYYCFIYISRYSLVIGPSLVYQLNLLVLS